MPARFPAWRPCLILIVLALAGCAPSYRPPADTLTSPDAFNYYIRVATASADRYEVTLAAERVRRDSLDFVFPAWIPGRYHPGPGRARPENFTARDGRGRPIAVRRLSTSAWRLYPPDGADYVAISYHIIPEASDEPLAFRPQLDLHGGFAPGGALFGYLLGFEERPVTVAFDLPAGWRVATPLRPGGANRFAAPSYATLPGTPIVVGDRLRDYKLFVQGRPHQVTVSGADADFAPDSLLRLISETIDHGARFFGRPTYERYLFAVQFVPPDADGIGAMGQASGSAFFLPVLSGDRLREGGIGGLLLHQYLHAWYPGSFGPGALRRPEFMTPPVLADEWLIEGTAEYYARLLPVRYGGVGRHAFYDTMGELLTLWRELDGGPRIDLAALSRRGGAAETDDTARLISGGTLAAFVIDLAIRDDTHGTRGLDQLMYFLQKRTPETGYRPDALWDEVTVALDLPADALQVLGERGSLSLEIGLARAGLRMVERDERQRALGARLEVGSGGQFVIAGVRSGSTAAGAGLREGDRVLKINETPIGPDAAVATRYALTAYIRDAATGAPVTFEVLRDGEPRTLRGTVRESRSRRVTIEEIATASQSALLVRSSLFRPQEEGR